MGELMKPCIECDAESVPTEVIDGVQVYECHNKHRWGLLDERQERKIRNEIRRNRSGLSEAA
jgi:hypothetical protein